MLAKESSGLGKFDLPEEVEAVLPSDPFEQLDIARKITSIALATRVSKLESESSRLRSTLHERDDLIADLQSQIESLHASLAQSTDRLAQADSLKERLLLENASLSNTVKKLNRDVSKVGAEEEAALPPSKSTSSVQSQFSETVNSSAEDGASFETDGITVHCQALQTWAPNQRNLDQLESLSKKLKAKTFITEAPAQSVSVEQLTSTFPLSRSEEFGSVGVTFEEAQGQTLITKAPTQSVHGRASAAGAFAIQLAKFEEQEYLPLQVVFKQTQMKIYKTLTVMRLNHQERLLLENASLSNTVKKLNRDVSKQAMAPPSVSKQIPVDISFPGKDSSSLLLHLFETLVPGRTRVDGKEFFRQVRKPYGRPMRSSVQKTKIFTSYSRD
ncbi:hypothetical protein Syun_029014 [Stephania yunnanensis]|uniref:Uncharacterized protein n=1 Tax=Stephania yunnanensis TaxID=152371 RepID=A0AAP0E4L4_9MAGN